MSREKPDWSDEVAARLILRRACSAVAFGAVLGGLSAGAGAADVFQDHNNLDPLENFNSSTLWLESPTNVANVYINRGDGVSVEWATRAPSGSAAFAGGALQMNSLGVLQFYNIGQTYTFQNSGLIMNGGRIANNAAAGSVILAGTVTLSSAATNVRSIGAGKTLQFDAAMGGVGGITVASGSGGEVVFAGASGSKTYGGTTQVNTGSTLRQGSAGALTTGTGDTNIIGTLNLGSFDGSVAALIGTGTVTKTSGNTTLTLGSNSVAAKTFSGVIGNGSSGTLAVTKTGTNQQVLAGASTYTGATTISAGQLQISGSGTLGNGSATTIDGTGTLELSSVGTEGNAISMVGRGAATPVHVSSLAGANTLSGVVSLTDATPANATQDNYNLNVAAGSLALTNAGGVSAAADTDSPQLNLSGAAGATGSISGLVDLNGVGSAINKTGDATWTLAGGASDLGAINASGANNLTVNGAVTAAGTSLTLGGTGTGVLGGAVDTNGTLNKDGAGTWTLSGSLTDTATINVNAGTLAQGAAAINGQAVTVTGTLDMGTFAASVNGLNGTGTVTNGGLLTFTGTGSFGGTIQGAGTSVRMNGAGTQTLTAANSFGGGTAIDAGALRLQGAGTLGAGAIAVGSGTGTLELATLGASLSNTLNLTGRGAATPAHVSNLAGNDTLTGTVNLVDAVPANATQDHYNLNVAANSLALNGAGGVSAAADTDSPQLNLGGAAGATGSISGLVDLNGAGSAINKTGDAAWALAGGASDLGAINASGANSLAVNGTVTAAGTSLTLGGTGAGVLGGAVDTNGTLNKDGSGLWTLNGSLVDTTTVNVNAGTLAQGAAVINGQTVTVTGTLDMGTFAASMNGLNGAGTVTNGGLLTFTGTGSFGGTIAGGSTSVRMNGAGQTQTLTAANSYGGTTAIDAGALRLQGAGTVSAGAITVSGTGTLELENLAGTRGNAIGLVGRGASTPAHIANIAGADTLSGIVALQDATPANATQDHFNLAATGGSLILSNAGGLAAAADTDSPQLNLSGAAGAFGSIAGLVDLNGATSAINKTGDATWTLSGGASDLGAINASGANNLTVNGAVTATGTSLTLGGTGTGVLGGAVDTNGTLNKDGSGLWTLNGSLVDTTAINVNAGTLTQGAAVVNGQTATVNGTLNMGGFAATIAGLNGSGSVTGGGQLNLTGSGTFGGSIDGASTSVVMNGAGQTQVLNGGSTYGGQTTISAGTLQIGANAALGNTGAGTTIQGTGVLSLTGNIATAEPLTLVGRSDADGNQVTSSGNNALNGAIALVNGPATTFDFGSTSGVLTIGGNVSGSGGANDTIDLGLDAALGASIQVNGSLDLNDASVSGGISGIGAGAKTVAGTVDLSTVGTAFVSNYDAGSLALTNSVNMSGVGGTATVANFDAGSLQTAALNMSGRTTAYIENQEGTLTVGGATNMTNVTTATVINQLGGNLAINGALDMTGGGSGRVTNAGAGVLTVNGTLTGVDRLEALDGTVAIGAGASVAGVTQFYTEGDGLITTADDLMITSGREIQGEGTMGGDGNYIVASGGGVEVGIAPASIADLDFLGDLTFGAGSSLRITVNVAGTQKADLLNVAGTLSLDAAMLLDFELINLSGTDPIVFAQYGDLIGTCVDGGTVPGNVPFGWLLDCDYGVGTNQLALVRDPNPIPEPAPLILIAAGALGMGRLRRSAKR